MATLSVTIPDDEMDDVTAALCDWGGFTDCTPDNGQQALIDWITQTTVRFKAAQAQQAALAAVPSPTPPTIT